MVQIPANTTCNVTNQWAQTDQVYRLVSMGSRMWITGIRLQAYMLHHGAVWRSTDTPNYDKNVSGDWSHDAAPNGRANTVTNIMQIPCGSYNHRPLIHKGDTHYSNGNLDYRASWVAWPWKNGACRCFFRVCPFSPHFANSVFTFVSSFFCCILVYECWE